MSEDRTKSDVRSQGPGSRNQGFKDSSVRNSNPRPLKSSNPVVRVRLSDRAVQMPASPIRRLVPYADRAKARGIKVYHLNIGQPDVETPAEMMDGYHKVNIKVLS